MEYSQIIVFVPFGYVRLSMVVNYWQLLFIYKVYPSYYCSANLNVAFIL